ncbi:MAG: MBOAT family protein [Saprospiraceae bacterium]|nr:MBOAT family protein [Saprospiraceae bacterium]
MAGPIERASRLLGQFGEKKVFRYGDSVAGLRLVLWGLFKKIAIADNFGMLADGLFDPAQQVTGLGTLFGAFCFAFQIYADFSGYSDMAIGLSKMLGFELMQNFRTPYFSASLAEFWRRWHISLSTWFRDYLYIPLGGNRHGLFMTYRNNMLTMLLGGLWHGANWAFVFWGFLHGLFLIAQRLLSPVWRHFQRLIRLPAFAGDALAMAAVYLLTLIAWVFFRSGSIGLAGGDSFGTAGKILSGIMGGEGFHFSAVINKFQVLKGAILIGILLATEISNVQFQWNALQTRHAGWRLVFFPVLLWLIAFFGTFSANAFIYFQF